MLPLNSYDVGYMYKFWRNIYFRWMWN